MRAARPGLLLSLLLSLSLSLSLIGCKREAAPEQRAPAPTPPAAAPRDAAAADHAPTWYRAVIRSGDGVEVPFFLGVPAPGAPGQAMFRVGHHDVRADATFDGKTLKVPLAVHQTAVEAAVGPDGALAGTFSTTWRAWGASSLPVAARPVAAPVVRELGTLAAAAGPGAPVDLKERRTVWRLAMKDSGTARLVVEQDAPGELAAMLFFDTGNIVYLAGNARGDAAVLTGFDGTSGYRLELALAADRASARGKYVAGHRLDWRETLTATRGADFTLDVKRPARAGARIRLPDHPALAALPPGPLLVELAGSWCSTCRNAAPFLVELYREYHPRGLGMVTLLYEFSDDPDADARQAATFQQTYGVTWPVIPIRGGVDDIADIFPAGLEGVDPSGFPITLFLAPDRALVALHAGFPAADAGEEYRRVTAELRAHVEALLARKR